MVVYNNDLETTIESGNLPDASTRGVALKRYTGEDGEVATAMPGRKLHRCIALSFCFLCILQAALNISLRLAFSSPPGSDASYKNLTEEIDNLRFNFDLQQTSLMKEKDELKKQLNYYASQQNSLTTERDELKRKRNDFAHYSQQGWVYYRSSFYYISSIKKTWQGSRDDCLQKGADLMIINTKEEQEFARQYQKIMWIGLTDTETEGVWKWVDGTPLITRLFDFGFSYWGPAEPNNYNGRNEDCVEIRFYKNENNWNDSVCENENFWICEKEMAL